MPVLVIAMVMLAVIGWGGGGRVFGWGRHAKLARGWFP